MLRHSSGQKKQQQEEEEEQQTFLCEYEFQHDKFTEIHSEMSVKRVGCQAIITNSNKSNNIVNQQKLKELLVLGGTDDGDDSDDSDSCSDSHGSVSCGDSNDKDSCGDSNDSNDDCATDIVESYDINNDNNNLNLNQQQDQQWKQVRCRMPIPLFNFAAVNLIDNDNNQKENNYVYLYGGYNKKRGGAQNGCYRYDVINDTYTIMPPMKIKRAYLAKAVIKTKLFAIGGINENYLGALDTVEYLDMTCVCSDNERQWQLLEVKMNRKRWGSLSETIDGILYVFGGFDEYHNYLDTIEIYDTSRTTNENNKFILLDAKMKTERAGAATVVLGYHIILIGGQDNGKNLNTIEIFNTKTLQFETNSNNNNEILFPTLAIGRSYCDAVLVDNNDTNSDDDYVKKIIVVGGYGYGNKTAEFINIRRTSSSLLLSSSINTTATATASITTTTIPQNDTSNINTSLLPKNDPSMWSITFDQLLNIHNDLSNQYGSLYNEMTMIDVNEKYIIPYCILHGKSIALGHNPNGCKIDVFITHCWQEPFQEFIESIIKAYNAKFIKPNLWICAFALYQGNEETIQKQLGNTLQESPFVLALQRANEFLIVRNRMVDLYSRIWCVCEVMEAKKIGLIPHKVQITGPNNFSKSTGSVLDAQASKKADRINVMRALLNEFDVDEIDNFVMQFRKF